MKRIYWIRIKDRNINVGGASCSQVLRLSERMITPNSTQAGMPVLRCNCQSLDVVMNCLCFSKIEIDFGSLFLLIIICYILKSDYGV